MAVNDEYDFLGLPPLGSGVGAEITEPSGVGPLFSPDYIEDYAGFQLPSVDMVAPPQDPLSSQAIGDFMLNVRPFERGLSATGLVTPEQEEQFISGRLDRSRQESQVMAAEYQQALAERLAQLESINEAKQVAGAELISAQNNQDLERANAAEARLAELTQQEQALQADYAALEQELADTRSGFGQERSQFEGRISDLDAQIAALTGERDLALSEQDSIRAQAAESQKQALENLRGQLQGTIGEQQTEIDRLLGLETGYQQQISDLQAQIEALKSGSSPADEPVDSEDIFMEPSLDEDMEEFYADQVRDEDVGGQTDAFASYQSPFANMATSGQNPNLGLGSYR